MKRKNLRDLEETRDKFYEELERAVLDYGAKLVDGAHHRAYRIHPTYRHEIVDKFGYRGERYAFTADYAMLCIVDKGYYIFGLPIPEKQQEYILIQGGYSTSAGFVIPKTIRVYRNVLWYDLWEYRSEDMFKLNPKELNNVGEITKLYSDEYEKWVRRSNSQGKAMLIDAINFKDVRGSKALLDAMFKLT